MKQNTEFDHFREIYIDNLMSRQFPILPAFYYYLNHTQNKNILTHDEFEEMLTRGCNDYRHPISLEYHEAILDVNQVYNILDDYYEVRQLCDKEGVLIKLI